MKPFDLEKAKAGHPVCTRDGRDVRIICFDRLSACSIVALIKTYDKEEHGVYYNSGKYYFDTESRFDLFMKSTKKTYWLNLFECYEYGSLRVSGKHFTKEEAIIKSEPSFGEKYLGSFSFEFDE